MTHGTAVWWETAALTLVARRKRLRFYDERRWIVCPSLTFTNSLPPSVVPELSSALDTLLAANLITVNNTIPRLTASGLVALAVALRPEVMQAVLDERRTSWDSR